MAIRLLSPEELGEKVREVRRRLGLGSVEMSLAMGQDKQYISRFEKGRKRVDRAEKAMIAEFAAGKADFVNTTPDEILHFLEGELEWDVRLRPKLGVVDPEGGLTSDPDDSALGGNLRALPGLNELTAVAV